MSAGFIFTIAEDPTWSLQDLVDTLANMDSKELATAAEWGGLFHDEEEQSEREFRNDVFKRIQEARAYVDTDLDYPYSDVGWFTDKNGDKYVLSGGMSNGDSPSEAFDHIQVLSSFEYYINEQVNP